MRFVHVADMRFSHVAVNRLCDFFSGPGKRDAFYAHMSDFLISPDLLRELMQLHGRTQEALARALGVDQSAVSRILSGKRKIKLEEAPIIMRYLEETDPRRGRPVIEMIKADLKDADKRDFLGPVEVFDVLWRSDSDVMLQGAEILTDALKNAISFSMRHLSEDQQAALFVGTGDALWLRSFILAGSAIGIIPPHHITRMSAVANLQVEAIDDHGLTFDSDAAKGLLRQLMEGFDERLMHPAIRKGIYTAVCVTLALSVENADAGIDTWMEFLKGRAPAAG